MRYCVRNWWTLINESNYIRWVIASVAPFNSLCTKRQVTAEHLSLLLPVRRRQRCAAVSCHTGPCPTLPGHSLLLQVVEHVNHITQTSWSLLHFGCCEDACCRHMLATRGHTNKKSLLHCNTHSVAKCTSVTQSYDSHNYIHTIWLHTYSPTL